MNDIYKIMAKVSFIALIIGLVSISVAKCAEEGPNNEITCDTIVYHDTIFIDRPVAKDSIITKIRYVRLPVEYRNTTDTIHDTTFVEIPITQKKYETKDYRAYVSGFQPSLDSLYIYRHNSVIERTTISKKWKIGLSAGYGLTPKGFQPYVGISLNYRLWK